MDINFISSKRPLKERTKDWIFLVIAISCILLGLGMLTGCNSDTQAGEVEKLKLQVAELNNNVATLNNSRIELQRLYNASKQVADGLKHKNDSLQVVINNATVACDTRVAVERKYWQDQNATEDQYIHDDVTKYIDSLKVRYGIPIK